MEIGHVMAHNDVNGGSDSSWSSDSNSSDATSTPIKNKSSAGQLTNDHANGLATAMMNVIRKPIETNSNVIANAKASATSSNANASIFEKRLLFLSTKFNSRDDLKRAATQVNLAIARSK